MGEIRLDRAFVDSLRSVKWLDRCGVAEPLEIPWDATQLLDWSRAIEVYGDQWPELKFARFRELTSWFASNNREVFNYQWNDLVKEARAEAASLLGNVTVRFELSRFLFETVSSDIKLAIIEQSIRAKHPRVPVFYSALIEVYHAGHLPFGWDAGDYPTGFLVYV